MFENYIFENTATSPRGQGVKVIIIQLSAIIMRKSNIRLAKDTPYLALTGELWGEFCENFGENWQRYNSPSGTNIAAGKST